MTNMKSTLVRTAAAAAATVLVTVGGMAPALADHDHGKGASQDHRAAAGKDARPAQSAQPKAKGAKAQGAKAQGAKAQGGQSKGGNGRGSERGNGHTPVTVCHLLGNGSYNVLTFDENALAAHVDHGDLYPVPANGCPTAAETERPSNDHSTPGHVRVSVCHLLGNGGYHELTFDEHALAAHEAHGDLYPVPAAGCPAETAEETVPGTTPEQGDTPAGVVADDTTTTTDGSTVAGVEELAGSTTDQPRAAQVLGVEAVADVNRAAPVTGPLAGILPQTGAAQLGLAAAAGLVLVGAGATMVARRRTQGA
jgi:LPXTG-motif cell wall-anchored protein